MQPLVSILITTYNDGDTLKAALESCFAQTYGQLEILVLNNGSSDSTRDVLAALNEPRLRVMHEPVNLGIAPARNLLLQAAKGEFIAWLDADDVMLPARIERQLAWFKAHPETDLLGSWIYTDDPGLPGKKLPLQHEEISACLWFKNCMVQPALMSRNFYVKENIRYDEHYKNSVEDYALWYSLSQSKRFANQPEYLTVYHVTGGAGLGIKKRDNGFEQNLQQLWTQKWKALPLYLADEDKLAFQEFMYSNRRLSARQTSSLLHTMHVLQKWKHDALFRLILSLHYLRLWNNMNLSCKLRNIKLLLHLRHYREMKRRYLL